MSKKKKGKSRLEFPDLVQRYKSQDLKGVLQFFRKAKIKPHEQDDARRLWVELHQRLAADHFEKHEFSQAILMLEPLKPEDFPKNSEAFQAANSALKGLSRLYLGDWEAAAKDLESAPTEGEAADKLGFYYLLALTYGGKTSIPPTAADGQAPLAVWEKLTDKRRLYLQFTACLVSHNWPEAARLLSGMAPLSDLHGANLSALRSMLSGEALPNDLDQAMVKPLYKACTGLPLSGAEAVYLQKRPVIGPVVAATLAGSRRQDLPVLLAELCEQGIPLKGPELDFCLDQLPLELRPFALYNQAANLFRENSEENSEAINKLADKYAPLFFQVPESIFLYLRMVSLDAEEHRPGTFFTNLEQYLKRFGGSLSNAQLNEIGWLCFDAFVSSDLANKSGAEKKRLAQLSAKFPQIVGFKLWMLLEISIHHSSPPWQDALLDVFALPNVQDHGARIASEIDTMLKELSPKRQLFEKLLPKQYLAEFEREQSKKFAGIFEQLQKLLLSATLAQGISPRSKFVLDVLKTLHRHHAQFAGKETNPLPAYMIETLSAAYAEQLEFFEENTPGSPYHKDYQALKALPALGKILKLLDAVPQPYNLHGQLVAAVLDGYGSAISGAMVKKLEKEHFHLDLIPQTISGLTALVEGTPAAAEAVVRHFTDEFMEMVSHFECDCHEVFYLKLLDKLAKSCHLPHQQLLVYRLALAGKAFLTATEDPRCYNTSAVVLETVRRLMEKDAAFRPDTSFVIDVMAFTGVMAKKKNLKSLSKTFNYLKAFFEEKLGD